MYNTVDYIVQKRYNTNMKKYDVELSDLATLLTINITGDGSELLEYLPEPHKYARSSVNYPTAKDNWDFSYLWIKAKCRNIWNYYNDKNWTTDKYIRKYTDEELKMTRVEHIKEVNKKRKAEAYAKVVNAITGLFAEEKYKKKNGNWHISAIAKDLNIDRRTVTKYIKKFEENK